MEGGRERERDEPAVTENDDLQESSSSGRHGGCERAMRSEKERKKIK